MTADGENTSSQDAHSWETLVHFRLPNGSQETVHFDDFCFVYYDRYYKKTASKVGGPKRVEIRDVPREVKSIQNEDHQRLRFWKITSIRLEYRTEGAVHRLYMVATPASRRKAPIVWPVDHLRSANHSQLPHFRGKQDGAVVEVPFPPLFDEQQPEGKVLTGVDFKFVGQTKRHSWL
jgi:hypothetical protein